MTGKFGHQSVLVQSALRRMFASPLGGILNILVIGIALSLPAGMYTLLKNVQTLAGQLPGKPEISLFLVADSNDKAIEKIRTQIAQHSNIAGSRFVSRDAALQKMQADSALGDVIEGLEHNPLPDAFIITPRVDTAAALKSLRDELAEWDGVALAQMDSDWAYKLEALLGFGRMLALILGALLSVALIAVTFNTIRLQILTQREEIEVARLIGATNAFIRQPFLFLGAIQGLLGGIITLMILAIGIRLANVPLAEVARLYGSDFRLQILGWGDSLSLLLFSVYLGWLGAWLSVSRHLSRIIPR